LDTLQGFQGFEEWLSDGVIGSVGLARPAQKDVYDPILNLDAAVADEAIFDLDDALIALSGSETIEESVQDGGDPVL